MQFSLDGAAPQDPDRGELPAQRARAGGPGGVSPTSGWDDKGNAVGRGAAAGPMRAAGWTSTMPPLSRTWT